ncbi:MAG: ABC transporter substrate-binding protein [Promethearchaeota archaeon]
MTSVGLEGRLVARVFFVVLLLVFTFAPMTVQADGQWPEPWKNGPFIDKLYLRTTVDEGITIPETYLLLNDYVDMSSIYGELADPLRQAENVAVHEEPRNGYGLYYFNCKRYPYNITALRRAFAFALDKHTLTARMWGGYAEPQDVVVPAVHPLSIEGQTPYSYYSPQLMIAIDLLENAGFHIDPVTGFRNAPNGEPFQVLIEYSQGDELTYLAGVAAEETFRNLQIDAVSDAVDYYTLSAKIKYHEDFEVMMLGRYFDMALDYLAHYFCSDYIDVPRRNPANFENDTCDALARELLHTADYDRILELAEELQLILLYECPWVPIYCNTEFMAFRTGRFDWQMDGYYWWTWFKSRLKDELGGPFGGTLRVFWTPIRTLNFMSPASNLWDRIVTSLLYECLVSTDLDNNHMPWLAESYLIETNAENPEVLPGQSRFTFNLIRNATWSDGVPLTAADVAFTFNYYRDGYGNPQGTALEDMTAAYAAGAYKVIIEFSTESYWHYVNVAYKTIIPKHIFELIGIDGWQTWQPNPPYEPMVTSGTFYVSEWVRGEFMELTHSPSFFYRMDRNELTTTTTATTTTTTTTSMSNEAGLQVTLASGAISAAAVIMIGGMLITKLEARSLEE